MTNINAAFPSNYLKAADLAGRAVKLEMDRIQFEDVGGDQKPVLYFAKTDKGLVLNKTNAYTISDAFGEETDYWNGNTVELFATKVDFQGRRVDAIRLRAIMKESQTDRPDHGRTLGPGEQAALVATPARIPESDLDDEIPF